MKTTELSDVSLVAVYKNCYRSERTCEGCLVFGLQKCKTQVKDEMVRRYIERVHAEKAYKKFMEELEDDGK